MSSKSKTHTPKVSVYTNHYLYCPFCGEMNDGLESGTPESVDVRCDCGACYTIDLRNQSAHFTGWSEVEEDADESED